MRTLQPSQREQTPLQNIKFKLFCGSFLPIRSGSETLWFLPQGSKSFLKPSVHMQILVIFLFLPYYSYREIVPWSVGCAPPPPSTWRLRAVRPLARHPARMRVHACASPAFSPAGAGTRWFPPGQPVSRQKWKPYKIKKILLNRYLYGGGFF